MNDAAMMMTVETREIVVDEVFPHAPDVVWKTLTTPELMGRWLMAPTGFEAREGTHFTFQTTPAGEWDGVIRCQVLEVMPNERLAFSWSGGHGDNDQYGSRLETVVTWTLARVDAGTRLQLVHAGFRSPQNDFAFKRMSEGWRNVVARIEGIAGEQGSTEH